jgi:hypothetical protein
MEKYRIIETKVPVLSSNTQGIVDFVPEINHKSTYHVEELVTEKFLWMTFKSWTEVQFYRVYGTTDGTRFTSFESAQKHIDFREEPIRRNVVWKN